MVNVIKLLKMRLLIYLLLFLGSLTANAQFYVSGDNPYNIQWRQIKTMHATIVYPEGCDSVANRFANLLDYLSDKINQGWKVKPRPIKILINNQTIESNGFVTMAPQRMEIYLQAPPDNEALPWLEQLAIHEYRHVLQLDQLETGLASALKLIFGEQIIGLLSAQIPAWVFEGDAVYAETLLTNTGRGRLPSFEKGFRASTLARKKPYSLHQSILGSYKYNTPDHYELGYLLTSYGRIVYDSLMWSKLFRFTANTPFLISPSHFFISNKSKRNKKNFHKAALSWYKEQWLIQSAKINPSPYSIKNNIPSEQTNYLFPLEIDSNHLIATKFSLSKIPCFIIIDKNKKEKVLHQPGFFIPERPSYANGKMVWAEYMPHKRWQKKSYNDVLMLDINTRKVKQITHNNKYFSPSLSADASKIVCIEQTENMRFNLVVLNSSTGEILRKYSSPHGYSLHQPVFNNDASGVFLFFVSLQGKGIYSVDLNTGIFTVNMLEDYYQKENLSVFKNNLIYTSNINGIDNIYARNIDSDSTFQLTSSMYGSYFGTITSSNTLLYNDYEYMGYRIAESPINKNSWKLIDTIPFVGSTFIKKMYSFEPKKVDFTQVPDSLFSSKKYYKAAHLINIHSWSPFYYKYYNTTSPIPVSAGISILSQNLLSNAVTQFGAAYRNNQLYTTTSFVYSGFYPIIGINLYQGPDLSISTMNSFDRQVYNLNTELRLPINLTNNKFERYFVSSLSNITSKMPSKSNSPSIAANITARGTYSAMLKMAHRNIYPRYGFSANVGYSNNYLANYRTDQLFYRFYQYFQGLYKNHGFRLIESGKFNMGNSYMMGISIFSRGYLEYYTHQSYSLKADYAFPLFYPDLAWGSFLYLKRVRASLFYDYTYSDRTLEKQSNGTVKVINENIFKSQGVEIYGDFNFFNLPQIALSIGAGYYYRELDQLGSWELILDLPLDF